LKRTGIIDAAMTNEASQKGIVWSSYQKLYPIYYQDIIFNANLKQNPGY